MIDLHFSELAFLFIAYSILGWICESFVASIVTKRFVNRGFLFGPCDPSYGVAMLLIFGFSVLVTDNPIFIFFISALLGTLMEILTGFMFEYLFSARWWDHSKEKFHFRGRTSLMNFALFGVLGTVTLYFINPLLKSAVDWFYPESLRVLTTMILALLLLDLIFSIASMIDIRSRMEKIREIEISLENLNNKYHFMDKEKFTPDDIESCMEKHADNEEIYYIMADMKSILNLKAGASRIIKAFPKLVPLEYADEYKFLQLEKDKMSDSLKHLIHKHEFRSNTAKQDEPREKQKLSPWASIKRSYSTVTVTRLIWVFLIGCVAGYVIETLYCVLHNGYFESRQGMIYGPFSQVYGLGAVLLVLFLDPIAKKKMIWLFLFSALIGGLFEAGMSYMQELMFGTTSWNYSDEPLSMFGGRTSGLYMFFWGILGTVYMRLIYPKIISLVDSIPIKPRRFFTISIAVVLTLDLLISGIAVGRWSQRQQDIPPANKFEQFIDDHYNDAYMRDVYPHMKIS